MLSSSLRERDEIHAKSTSDANMIEIKKKRSDNDKTVKELRAKIILIAELYKFRAKKMMNVLDQLIKTSRVTRANDVSSVFKSTKTIKKLKEVTTRLKKIAKKKKTYQKKSSTWATIARREVVIIKFNVDAKKTSILSSRKELKIAIKMIEQKKIQMTQKMTLLRSWMCKKLSYIHAMKGSYMLTKLVSIGTKPATDRSLRGS